MKKNKLIHTLILSSLILGSVAPAAVQATEVNSSSSTTVSSAMEPSSSTSSVASSITPVDPSTSSTGPSFSSEDPSVSSEDPSGSSTNPSTSLVDPSTSETSSDASSSSTSTVSNSSSSSSTSTSGAVKEESKTVPELSSETATLEAIIGKDNQYKVTNTKTFPYRTVVLLAVDFGNGDEGHGTGVLIAPNLVLTVAHNVYSRKTGKWAKSVLAVPGMNGNTRPYGIISVSKYYALRDYKVASSDDAAFYNDMAVLRLSKSVPSSVGYLPVSGSLSKNERVQIPGYPGMTSSKSGYMYTSFGNVNDMDGTLIGHLVDTEGGNSGSPILNSKNQVVGVHTGGSYTKEPYGTQNFGRRVNQQTYDLIALAKNNGEATLDISTPNEKTGNTYRLYHPGIQRHLYTQDLDEAKVLKGRGWNFEGVKFKTATKGTPVYRLYGFVMREHLYTTSVNERDTLARTGAWRAEGIAFYSAGKKPVYRLYHSGLRVHLYTADTNEVKVLGGRGWKNEGIAFYTLN